MATMNATVTGWAQRVGSAFGVKPTWYPSSGVKSLSSSPLASATVWASCPTTSATSTTASNNKYTVMIAVKMPSDGFIKSISNVSITFKAYKHQGSGALFGSLRTVDQSSGSTTNDTINTFRDKAVGSEASLTGLSTSAKSVTMEFSGSFSAGTTYYLFLYTKSTGDMYVLSPGSSNFSSKITYTEKKYTVTYYANGGTGAPGPQVKEYNKPLTLSSTTPTKDSVPAGSYTVTLDANGGASPQSALSAERTTLYWFSHWNTSSKGTGDPYSPSQSYSGNSDLNLYAIYDDETITGSVLLPTPTRNGYDFLGWATSSGADSGITGGYTPPEDDIKLYAIWKAKGLVYISDGVSFSAYQIFIYDGSSWDMYCPYVYDGTEWSMCS